MSCFIYAFVYNPLKKKIRVDIVNRSQDIWEELTNIVNLIRFSSDDYSYLYLFKSPTSITMKCNIFIGIVQG